MSQHAREPDPSSPFARYAKDESHPAQPIAGELESVFLPESDNPSSARRIASRPGSSIESVADLFPSEGRRAAPPAPAPPAPAPRVSAPPSPRRRRSVAIAPIWLAVAAICGVALGAAGYSSIGNLSREPRVPATNIGRPIDSIAPVVVSQPIALPSPPARPARSAAQRSTPKPSAPRSIDTPRRSSPPLTTAAPRIGRPDPAPRRPGRERLAPSAIAALPHVPVAPPLTTSTPFLEPRNGADEIREQRIVRSLLEAYRLAYERLDAPTVAALWPGVDSRSLTRTFNTLRMQRMTFDRCTTTITGAVATARCDGMLTYARRIGDSTVQSRRMTWAFALQRTSGEWRISRID